MGWLDQSTIRRRRTSWKEMSLEVRMMFVYHGCMMALFMAGSVLTIKLELAIATLLIAVLTAVSLRRRREKQWHWQNPGWKGVAKALGTVTVMGFFLYAATPMFSPARPQFLPWYLAGFGIGLFNVLSTLNLVQSTEKEFASGCGEHPMQTLKETTPALNSRVRVGWKQLVKGAFLAYFLAVWVTFVCFFYFDGKAYSGGSATPTATQTEPMTQHGRTVYISRSEKRRDDLLGTASTAGIVSVFALIFLVHFLLGVKLVDNVPTLSEFLAKRRGSGVAGS